jgi:hypothetical protein
MAFYLVMDQGGGCDYTIRCGLNLKKITGVYGDPKSMGEAEAIVVANSDYLGNEEEGDFGDGWYESGYLTPNCPAESRIDSARILEVVGEQAIDLDSYIAASKARIDGHQAKAAEGAERAEFERLKRKFEQ